MTGLKLYSKSLQNNPKTPTEVGSADINLSTLPTSVFCDILNKCGGLQRSCGGTVVAGSIDGGGCGGCGGFLN